MPYLGGTYTYALTGPRAPIGQVRLLIPDTDFSSIPTGLAGEQPSVLFADEEYAQFLAWSGNDPVFAAIQALLTIANNRALMAIRVSLGGGGEVDYGQVAGELRQQAEALREWYTTIPAEAASEIDWSDLSLRKIYWNDALRSSG